MSADQNRIDPQRKPLTRRSSTFLCVRQRQFQVNPDSSRTMIDDSYYSDDSAFLSEEDNEHHILLRPMVETLASWGLEAHIDEAVHLIFREPSPGYHGLAGLSVQSLASWIHHRQFLTAVEKRVLITNVEQDSIDGDVFMSILESKRYHVLYSQLSMASTLILGLLWVFWSFDLSSGDLHCPSNLSLIGVREGFISDLSSYSTGTATALVHSNNQAVTSGEGSVYGRLIVIGYSEYRVVDKVCTPFGPPNRVFDLYRRNVGNGLDVSITTDDDQEFHMDDFDVCLMLERPSSIFSLQIDDNNVDRCVLQLQDASASRVDCYLTPLSDRFQIGRALHSTNDIVIPGALHLNEDGHYTGPVSRWCCRVECERLPPYRARIYAGGLDDEQRLNVTTADVEDSRDAFTTHGVWIRKPQWSEWIEVSATGLLYSYTDPMDSASSPSAKPSSKRRRLLKNDLYTNVLEDGTLIDVGGVLLVYQSPMTMVLHAKKAQDPRQIVEQWRSRGPQCPVQLHDIVFDPNSASTVNGSDRKRRAQRKVFEEECYKLDIGATSLSGDVDLHLKRNRYGGCPISPLYGDICHSYHTPVHIPFVDYQHIPENHRPYVYPACGHVHAFHKSLATARQPQCPVCRTLGPFVPLIFSYDPVLDIGSPTHVFNPCGHMASLEMCRKWSAIPRPVHHNGYKDIHDAASHSLYDDTGMCPYCAEPLRGVRPFSRLIIQLDESHHRPCNSEASTFESRPAISTKQPVAPTPPLASGESSPSLDSSWFEDVHHSTPEYLNNVVRSQHWWHRHHRQQLVHRVPLSVMPQRHSSVKENTYNAFLELRGMHRFVETGHRRGQDMTNDSHDVRPQSFPVYAPQISNCNPIMVASTTRTYSGTESLPLSSANTTVAWSSRAPSSNGSIIASQLDLTRASSMASCASFSSDV